MRPKASGLRSAPAAMPLAASPSRPRPPSAVRSAGWTPRRWPTRSVPGWPSGTVPAGGDGGRRRRQAAARRPHRGTRRRRPPGAPAGGDGPHQSRGAGPTPGRRRSRGGARVRPAAGRARPSGTVVTADALHTHPEAAEFLVGGKQATTCWSSRPTSPPCWTAAPACPGTRCPSWTAPATVPTAASRSGPQGGLGPPPRVPHAAQVVEVTRKTRTLATPRFRT
jgi:hypothetical protein